jgi:hypothetical protein
VFSKTIFILSIVSTALVVENYQAIQKFICNQIKTLQVQAVKQEILAVTNKNCQSKTHHRFADQLNLHKYVEGYNHLKCN